MSASAVEPLKLHPLSILYRTVRQLGRISFLVFIFFFGGTTAAEGISVFLIVGVSVAVAFVGILAWQVAYYRRFEYEITDDTFDIRSGVVSRRNREIPLRRVQNVDVTENVVHRILGIAQVNIETAGGSVSEANLRYVGEDIAREIQRDVRRRKKKLSGDKTDEGEEEEAGERGEKLYEISGRELLLLSTFSIDFRLVAFAFFILSFVPPGRLEDIVGITFDVSAIPIFVLGVFVAILLWMIGFGTSFSRYYGFVLRRIDDTLSYERGLFNRYSGSIPISKIQTFTVDENVLKRYFDYATLGVETAGYSPTQARQQGSETAVPFAKRDRVIRLAKVIDDVEVPEFTLPPKRARRRYAIRYSLLLGVISVLLYLASLYISPPDWYLPLLALPLTPVAAHLKWRNRGYYLGDEYVATRNGFWNRTVVVLPYYRVQNIIESSTILQRRWTLATVTIDTAGSSGLRNDEARAVDIGFEDAEVVREKVRDKLQESLAERRVERRRRKETWLDSIARESPDAREGVQDDDSHNIRGDGSEQKDKDT